MPAAHPDWDLEPAVSNRDISWAEVSGASAADVPNTHSDSRLLPNAVSTFHHTATVSTPMDTVPSQLVDDWSFDIYYEHPSWTIDPAFDIASFETPFAVTMAELGQGMPNDPFCPTTLPRKPTTAVENLWFTRLDEARGNGLESRNATPSTLQEVDDEYRRALHGKLQIKTPEESLPSSDFLNLCVREYFARFHPVFPVIHAPTFRPSRANTLLLLSICSVGSLLTGSVNAADRGARIFESLNKAILATWDKLMARDAEEVLPMVQAALIGQTFGLLSGDPRHLATVDAFHGTVISWARRKGIFNNRDDTEMRSRPDHDDLETAWHKWARREESIRAALGLYIHDAELSNIFHHEPYLRHANPSFSSHGSSAFMASGARGWAQQYECTSQALGRPRDGSDAPNPCRFTIYARLQSISARILEMRLGQKLQGNTRDQLSQELINFYHRYLAPLLLHEPDDLGICILWHLCFVSIYADFDLLERAIGRDGCDVATRSAAEVSNWAASIDAKRCIIHILLLQKKLEAFAVGSEPAIHIPRSIFLVAIAWYCYAQYIGEISSATDSAEPNSPEFEAMGLHASRLLFEAHRYRHGKPTSFVANEILCRFIDLLQRVGHWEIARKFALILRALVQGERNGD
ncbi:hypothetical protein LTS10_001895 [Elasticomyces elasticus]|nr:hypothetical protein LTS10_001895 [Elasticomyces elasticus]